MTQNMKEVKIFILNNKIMLHIILESHLIERHYFKISSYSIYHTIHPNGTEYGDIIKNLSLKITYGITN